MTIIEEGSLCLVGAGKMGSALLAGWLKAGEGARAPIVVIDPGAAPEIEGLAGAGEIILNPDLANLEASPPSVCILAVKPQVMDEAVKPFEFLRESSTLIVSIAAGRSILSFEKVFGPEASIVRAVPNTPAAIGKGISVACANGNVSQGARERATGLLKSVGEVVWIDDEDKMDAVTAVSGSGPAYVFLLIEALAAAGVAQGLDKDLAMRLAVATVEGAGALALRSDVSAEELRHNVTSPGGTTAAALAVLMGEGGLTDLMAEAVAAATARSKELG